MVANGAVFETGVLPEEGRQVEDSAGDMIKGNGEVADMILDNEMHTAADDMGVSSEMMVWERLNVK